ncbi:MAG: uracil-DNA glycosylase [candidate division NC10 bacterium]|nr:uracil-DNA glycosylase [candidate division NC10 bacterium]
MDALQILQGEVVACRKCPRLVANRERVAREKVRRYRDEEYWGKPIPGFGDPDARLLIVGLAPAAHGGNRTGLIFTGDRSGDFLTRALHRAGFANQPWSRHRRDGLGLRDCYITAAIRCAPPENTPTREELLACRPYLVEELRLLRRVRVVVVLGRIAFEAFLRAWVQAGRSLPSRRPGFAHGAMAELPGGMMLVASYHPSQQNTQTGRLTPAMFQRIFARARRALSAPANRPRSSGSQKG